MRRLCLFLTVILLWAALSGCRGGGLVFKGTHQSQDAALLSKLSEKYPEMEFECTGRTEGAVHTVEAADGTVFPAWTAALRRAPPGRSAGPSAFGLLHSLIGLLKNRPRDNVRVLVVVLLADQPVPNLA